MTNLQNTGNCNEAQPEKLPAGEKFELYVDEDGDYVLKMKDRPHHRISVHGEHANEAVANMVDTIRELDVMAIAEKIDIPITVATNFPSSSQNQAVSSGVEGAHEGTTADKSGSREPEKLNNAHDYAAAMADWLMSHYRGKMDAEMADELESEITKLCVLFENRVALAESSLSSPPCYHVSIQSDGCGNYKCCDCGQKMVAASPELLPTQLPKEK